MIGGPGRGGGSGAERRRGSPSRAAGEAAKLAPMAFVRPLPGGPVCASPTRTSVRRTPVEPAPTGVRLTHRSVGQTHTSRARTNRCAPHPPERRSDAHQSSPHQPVCASPTGASVRRTPVGREFGDEAGPTPHARPAGFAVRRRRRTAPEPPPRPGSPIDSSPTAATHGHTPLAATRTADRFVPRSCDATLPSHRRAAGRGSVQLVEALSARTHAAHASMRCQRSSRVPAKLCMWAMRGQTNQSTEVDER